MDMIASEEVIRRIELHFAGGTIEYLSSSQATVCQQQFLRHLQFRSRTNH
jgi:hypothetical protein